MIRNPHNPNNITIPLKEYYSLQRDKAMRQALDHGGVDNWEWHSEAYREYLKETKGKPWYEGGDDDDN